MMIWKSLLPKSNFTAPKKHLVFINYYFPPMGGGGVQRIVKFLKYLDYQSYNVTVLTVQKSFFYSYDYSLNQEIPQQAVVIRSGSLDPFRLIYLFEKLFNLKKSNGNSSARQESGGRIRRIAMSIFVPDSRLLWLPFALLKLWRINREQPIDAIIASMPPFTTGLIGALAGRFMKLPLFLDFRDGWTNNPYLPGIGKFQTRLSKKLEKVCVKQSSAIIFVNPALQKYYLKKYPDIIQKPFTTIRNGFDPEDFSSLDSQTLSQNSRPFTIGIVGTIYSQGNLPLTLINAIKSLNKDHTGLHERLRLTLVGKWPQDFISLVNQQNLDRIISFIPYLPHRKALAKAQEFDALALAIDSRLPGSSCVTPGRIYEYLYLKKPLLALCPLDSDLAYLVKHSSAGEVVEFTDVTNIRRVIEEWINNKDSLKDRYQFIKLQEYSRKDLTKLLMRFIDNALNK